MNKWVAVDKGSCYNRCDSQLLLLRDPRPVPVAERRPPAHSYAGHALLLLDDWCQGIANTGCRPSIQALSSTPVRVHRHSSLGRRVAARRYTERTAWFGYISIPRRYLLVTRKSLLARRVSISGG